MCCLKRGTEGEGERETDWAGLRREGVIVGRNDGWGREGGRKGGRDLRRENGLD